MQHVYIHIPFCLKKCAYCDFCSVTDIALVDRYVAALCSEIEERGGGANRNESIVETLYFGGGTPSILSTQQISKIINQIKSFFNISSDAEMTIEVNPETVDRKKLLQFKEIGFNRLSIGIQSFDDDELKYLGRVHDSQKARETLDDAVKVFNNVSCDLIFGLPVSCTQKLKQNIDTAANHNLQHISCYELTYEKDTLIYNDRNVVGEDGLIKQYDVVKQAFTAKGYNQYEISNYARDGFECRHNLGYWSDKSYIGFGASAHSYDYEQRIRWANTSDIQRYIDGEIVEFTEKSCDIDRMITCLRKTCGMPENQIPERFTKKVDELTSIGLLKKQGGNVAYTEKGMLLANRVLLELSTCE